MRADRLIAIMMLLQAKGRMTAARLARQLEVSERTVYRDIDALGVAGVPVVVERGPGGGVWLMDGYRTNLTGLTEAEVRALFMQASQGALADLGLDGAVEAAMRKLSAALPGVQRHSLEQMRQRIHLDGADWFAVAEAVPLLHTVEEAVWQERRLHLSYVRSDERRVRRWVEPYGLVAKAGTWYLVGAIVRPLQAVANKQLAAGFVQVYRISRILELVVSDEHFARPADFDLAGYWADWCRHFEANVPRYYVTVRIAPEVTTTLPRIYGGEAYLVERVGEADENGWATLRLAFDSFETALANTLVGGERIEVLEPAELRERVRAVARKIVAFYQRKSEGLTG